MPAARTFAWKEAASVVQIVRKHFHALQSGARVINELPNILTLRDFGCASRLRRKIHMYTFQEMRQSPCSNNLTQS